MQYRIIRFFIYALLAAGAGLLLLRGPAAIEAGTRQAASKSQTPQKQGQQPPQKPKEDDLQLGTELVTVPFSVTDKRNAYINDLKQADIQITEDGKPQQIFSLTHETNLPLTMAILIDTSGSQELSLPQQRDAALKFFKSVMKPNKDVAAIVTFSGDADLAQGLTGDIDRLTRALDKVVPAQSSAALYGGTPPINGNSRNGSTAIYDAIFATVDDQLGHEAGRRVIILLTDGDENSSRLKMRDAIERAWRSEVQIYSIGVQGAQSGGYGIVYTPVVKSTLNKLAEETGGRAFFPSHDQDLYRAFRQIEDDLRQQYILSYSPSNAAHDGSFRSIKVEVPARKELQVRHRRGYFAIKQSS